MSENRDPFPRRDCPEDPAGCKLCCAPDGPCALQEESDSE